MRHWTLRKLNPETQGNGDGQMEIVHRGAITDPDAEVYRTRWTETVSPNQESSELTSDP